MTIGLGWPKVLCWPTEMTASMRGGGGEEVGGGGGVAAVVADFEQRDGG